MTVKFNGHSRHFLLWSLRTLKILKTLKSENLTLKNLKFPPTHISKYWKLIMCIFKRKVKKNFTLEHFRPLKIKKFLQPW